MIEEADARISTAPASSQSYGALVWRRLRKSTPGMLGLTLVSMLIIMALFADFFAPNIENNRCVNINNAFIFHIF